MPEAMCVASLVVNAGTAKRYPRGSAAGLLRLRSRATASWYARGMNGGSLARRKGPSGLNMRECTWRMKSLRVAGLQRVGKVR
jgi:hypothetical protein